MIRGSVLCLLLATAAAPGDCDTELVLRWNTFAAHANAHVRTRQADPDKRAKDLDKLDREWAALRSCACF